MTTIDKVIEYVLYTPCNSNSSILRSLLEALIKDNSGEYPEPDPDTIYIYDGGPVEGWVKN